MSTATLHQEAIYARTKPYYSRQDLRSMAVDPVVPELPPANAVAVARDQDRRIVGCVLKTPSGWLVAKITAKWRRDAGTKSKATRDIMIALSALTGLTRLDAVVVHGKASRGPAV